MRSFRVARIGMLACLVPLLAAATAWSQQPKVSSTDHRSSPSPHAKSEHPPIAFLGVEVESLHPSLASHLPSDIAHGQGVLVAYVSPDSPADKAGLKQHDILTSYGDQKLYAPEQLSKLVRADQPQHEVTLGIVRGGKSQQLKVTLGSEAYEPESPLSAWEQRLPGDWNWGFFERPIFQRQPHQTADSAWESFDSMSLRKVGDHNFRVEINYLDKSGKKQTHSFEGTREEIRRDIEAEDDLPASERSHLLSSLGMTNDFGERSARFPLWNYGPWSRPY